MKYIDDLSYLAAPKRRYLSLMMRNILNNNLLEKTETHLDYGCGHGGDVKILRDRGYKSVGYDPYYFPQLPDNKFDVVSCGHVLNVLTSPQERLDVVRKCWDLTNDKLIIAATIKDVITIPELLATIHIAIALKATRIDTATYLIDKSSPAIETFTREEAIAKIQEISNQGWIAPRGAVIKGYCTSFQGTKSHFNNHPKFGLFPAKRYLRLSHKQAILPGKNDNLVKNVHLGIDRNSEKYKWAEAAILRRNAILRIKFHTLDFSFIDEFVGFRNWEFLDLDWRPDPDSLGYTRQDRKPQIIRNPNPGKPLFN